MSSLWVISIIENRGGSLSESVLLELENRIEKVSENSQTHCPEPAVKFILCQWPLTWSRGCLVWQYHLCAACDKAEVLMASSALKYDLRASQFFKFVFAINRKCSRFETHHYDSNIACMNLWHLKLQHVNQLACLYVHVMIVTDYDSWITTAWNMAYSYSLLKL